MPGQVGPVVIDADHLGGRSPARLLLVMMHNALDVVTETEYVHSLRVLEAHFGGKHICKWSLFGGTGMSSRMCDELAAFWEERYNVKLAFDTYLFAEKAKKKIEFLRSQHPNVKVITDNVADLKGVSAVSVGDRKSTILRPPDFVDMGIPCTARSSYNSTKKKENLNCVQEEREATGIGFMESKLVCFNHNPGLAVAECVPALFEKSPPVPGEDGNAPEQKLCDAEWMCEEFRQQGWFATASELDTSDYAGEMCHRKRAWWAFISAHLGEHSAMQAWHTKLVHSFKLGDGLKFAGSNFVIMDYQERKDRALALNMPLLSDFLKTAQQCLGEPDWKGLHLRFFQANGLTWPLQMCKLETRSVIIGKPLTSCECDKAYFLDAMFEPLHDLELLDINPQLAWILGSVVDEDGKVKREAGKTGLQRTPWHAGSPTQVGSGKLLVRQRLNDQDRIPKNVRMRQYVCYVCIQVSKHARTRNNNNSFMLCMHYVAQCLVHKTKDRTRFGGKEFMVRLLEPFEAMNIMGWSDLHHWVKMQPHDWETTESLELLFNLAGNAFNVFHVMPWLCASISVWGRFLPKG